MPRPRKVPATTPAATAPPRSAAAGSLQLAAPIPNTSAAATPIGTTFFNMTEDLLFLSAARARPPDDAVLKPSKLQNTGMWRERGSDSGLDPQCTKNSGDFRRCLA